MAGGLVHRPELTRRRLLLVLCAASFGCAARQPHPADLQAALTRLREAYVQAYNEGSADALQGLYTARAVRMPYDAQMQEGLEAIMAYYRRSFASRRHLPVLRLQVGGIEVHNSVAMEFGRYHERLTPLGGGQPLLETGKYVVLARRGADGVWRYDWTIFNRDAPAGPVADTIARAGRIDAGPADRGGM